MRPNLLLCSFSAESWTRVPFVESLINLEKDSFDWVYRHFTRRPIPMARQQATDIALFGHSTAGKFTHICCIDDDQCEIPQSAIKRLLGHGRDIVAAVNYRKVPPYEPLVYEEKQGAFNSIGKIPSLPSADPLLQVDGTSFGMILISVDALKKMDAVDPRLFVIDDIGEDFFFCRRARQAGIPVFVDTSLHIGHITDGTVITQATREEYVRELEKRAASMGPPI